MPGRSLIAFCLLTLAASCAGAGNGLVRIEHPDQPIERRGVVCYAPAEGAWSLGEQLSEAETQLFFLQDAEAPAAGGKIGPSTYITLTIASVPEAQFSMRYPSQHAALDAFALAGRKPSSGRFKDLSSETTWGALQGQEFVRVARSSEERDNPNDPTAVLQLDERSTWLFHPHLPATVVRVVVSHRQPAGGAPQSLLGLEQSFLDKLAFR